MDTVTKERRSEIMSRVKSKDTRPEKVVRRVLHRMGYRFRLHCKSLPGKPDLALPRWKTVVFVHGCFWHGCPRCDRGTRVPKTNQEFWEAKVTENRRRDEEAAKALESSGWRILTVWECETGDPDRLKEFLSARLAGRVRP